MLLEGTHDKEGFHVQHNETGPGSIFKESNASKNLWTRLRFLISHRIAESAGWLFIITLKIFTIWLNGPVWRMQKER